MQLLSADSCTRTTQIEAVINHDHRIAFPKVRGGRAGAGLEPRGSSPSRTEGQVREGGTDSLGEKRRNPDPDRGRRQGTINM